MTRRDHGLHFLGPSPESRTGGSCALLGRHRFTIYSLGAEGPGASGEPRARGAPACDPASGVKPQTRAAASSGCGLSTSYPAIQPQPPLRCLSSPARRRATTGAHPGSRAGWPEGFREEGTGAPCVQRKRDPLRCPPSGACGMEMRPPGLIAGEGHGQLPSAASAARTGHQLPDQSGPALLSMALGLHAAGDVIAAAEGRRKRLLCL